MADNCTIGFCPYCDHPVQFVREGERLPLRLIAETAHSLGQRLCVKYTELEARVKALEAERRQGDN